MKAISFAKVAGKVLDKVGPVGAALTKNSPAIFTGAGIALLIGGNVLVGWATLKSKEVLEEEMTVVGEPEEDKKKALVKAGKVLGYYSPAIAATACGTLMVIHGHNVQAERLTAAVTAYSAMAEAFDAYRDRVRKEYGEEAEDKMFYGEEKVKTDIYEEQENGKTKKHKEEVSVRPVDGQHPYTVLFSDHSPDWTKNRSDNEFFLECQQVAANNKLRTRGYLFLNEVLEMLGLPYDSAGQFVGWLDEAYEGSKDGFVDFGITKAYTQFDIDGAKEDRVNPEPSMWLTMNVDGDIWDKIPLKKRSVR